MKSSNSAIASMMPTSGDSDSISNKERGARGHTDKRGDNTASRKYLQHGTRDQTGKYDNNTNKGESPRSSHQTRNQRNTRTSLKKQD